MMIYFFKFVKLNFVKVRVEQEGRCKNLFDSIGQISPGAKFPLTFALPLRGGRGGWGGPFMVFLIQH